MRTTCLLFAVLFGVALLGVAAARNDAPLADPKLPQCIVSLIDDVEVPAQEAGQLMVVEAREGRSVEVDELLARIDDKLAQNQKRIAEFEQQAAAEEATNDIRVQYAQANAAVAKQEYDNAVEANKITGNAITLSEVRKLKLASTSADLQISQTEFEMQLAGITAQAKAAEVDAAQTGIERREIRAPLPGLVTEVLREKGEWVQPGEPVFRVARMDRLWVEGFIRASEYSPAEVSNRQVTVEVALERGRTERFPGKVVFVNPQVEGDGEYRVRAEVVNKDVEGQWLLRPGHLAEMTIHLDEQPAAAREPPRRAARRPQ